MEKVNAFLKRKNIVFSAKRYGIDALGAMAQGLFCSLLIGTIIIFFIAIINDLSYGDYNYSAFIGIFAIPEIGFNQPKGMLYKTENPFA